MSGPLQLTRDTPTSLRANFANSVGFMPAAKRRRKLDCVTPSAFGAAMRALWAPRSCGLMPFVPPVAGGMQRLPREAAAEHGEHEGFRRLDAARENAANAVAAVAQDRKSTRLNSSHRT